MNATVAPLPRTQRLRTATHTAHEALDETIMAARPFDSRDRYARFLRMQYQFHRDIEPLFAHPALVTLVPDLADRCRLERILLDFTDLGLPAPDTDGASALTGPVDTATALGWFYVAEGSNLGAAILFKHAVALGLDAEKGARHLAGHPDGRARHWRAFTEILDALALAPAQEARLIEGARDAFARVKNHAERAFAD